MTAPNEEFNKLVKGLRMESPYGGTAKPGLTKRGKVALGIGATVIAGGGLIGYQAHQANQVEAQKIALKTQALELQKIKEQNRAFEVGTKVKDKQSNALQKSIDSCVKSHDDQVGKVLGVTYQDVVDGCQDQYGSTSTGDDLETAAASQTAVTNDSSGGINEGLLLGGGALALGLVYLAKRGTRSNPA